MPHADVTNQQRRRSKQLRLAATRAETLLWRYIKAHRIDGLGFRRQVAIGPFIVDFMCHAARLVVELDGESHDFALRPQSDARRDIWFQSQDYAVLRFTNEQVLMNLEGVVQTIREAAASRIGTPPSLTLPHKGGGNSESMAVHTSQTTTALRRDPTS